MLPLLFTIFLVLWLAFLGATVGSFLNVVVYRLPAGMSLVHPPSRCPRCEHAIRWHDNIPVLGWLWLRGRCRDCGEPISPRYPLVEAATGAMFLLLAWTGDIFPLWLESFVTVRGQWQGDQLLSETAAYLLQIGAICTLWSAALMQYDGHRPPPRMLAIMALVLGLGSFGLSLFTFGSPPWYRMPAANVLSGLTTGGFAMLSTVFWSRDESEQGSGRWPFVELAAICGLVFPISGMIWAIALAVAIALVAVLINRRANYPLLFLLAGLLVQQVLAHYYPAIGPRLLGFYRYWMAPVWFGLLLVLMTEAGVLIRTQCRHHAPP